MLDQTILHFFNQTMANPALDALMLSLSLIALGVFAGLGFLLSWRQASRKTGLAILLSLGFGLIWTLSFQYLVMRPRPEMVRLIWPSPNFPSYPSGHAAAAFATATVIIMTPGRSRWWEATGFVLLGASLVALSRVYLGHHYPSDILAGAILGASVGAACYGILTSPHEGVKRWRWLLWPQVGLVIIVTQMAYLNILPHHLLGWPLADKVMHFLLFGAVVFWFNFWLEGRRWQVKGVAIPMAVSIAFSLALIEEGFQWYSPYRSADWTDLVSDLAGMLTFWALSQALLNKDAQPIKTLTKD